MPLGFKGSFVGENLKCCSEFSDGGFRVHLLGLHPNSLGSLCISKRVLRGVSAASFCSGVGCTIPTHSIWALGLFCLTRRSLCTLGNDTKRGEWARTCTWLPNCSLHNHSPFPCIQMSDSPSLSRVFKNHFSLRHGLYLEALKLCALKTQHMGEIKQINFDYLICRINPTSDYFGLWSPNTDLISSHQLQNAAPGVCIWHTGCLA